MKIRRERDGAGVCAHRASSDPRGCGSAQAETRWRVLDRAGKRMRELPTAVSAALTGASAEAGLRLQLRRRLQNSVLLEEPAPMPALGAADARCPRDRPLA